MSNNSNTKLKTNTFIVENDTNTSAISAANIIAGTLKVNNQLQFGTSKIKKYYTSHNGACDANNKIHLGTYTIQGTNNNIIVKGTYNGQVNEKICSINFIATIASGGTTNNITETLTVKGANNSTFIGDINLYVNESVAPGTIEFVAVNRVTIQNASWEIEVLEREDYNGWTPNTAYTNTDYSPAGTISTVKAVGVFVTDNNRTTIGAVITGTHTLSVSGDIRSIAGKYYGNPTDYLDIKTTDSSFRFFNPNESATILTNGNVGIGSNTPGEKLVVDGNIQPLSNITRKNNNSTIGLYQNTTETDSVGYITLNTDGPSNNIGYTTIGGRRIIINDTSTNSSLGSTVVSITGGNVGINVLSPTDKLQVNGDVRLDSQLKVLGDQTDSTFTNIGTIGVKQTANAPAISLHANDGTRIAAVSSTADNVFITSETTRNLQLGTQTFTSRMFIASGGRVGINTTSPTSLLDINGDLNVTNALTSDGGVFKKSIEFTDSGASKRGIQGIVSTNDYWFIGGGESGGANTGYLEIATGNEGTEPIHVRQFTSAPLDSISPTRTLTLLDAAGYTLIPSRLYINTTSTVDPYKLQIRGTEITSTLGSVFSGVRLETAGNAGAGNVINLNTFAVRHTAGSDWTGVKYRIQHQVDTTQMAFIDFNPTNSGRDLSLGTNNVARLFISQTGRVGINNGTSTPRGHVDIVASEDTPTLFLGRTSGFSSISATTNLFLDSNTDIRLNDIGNSNVFIANGGGTVGIATNTIPTVPTGTKVHIAGGLNTTGSATITGTAQASKLILTSSSGQITFASDQLDIDDTDNATTSNIRLYRGTNHTGTKTLQLYRGDNSATVDAQIAASATNTFFAVPTDAKVGVGTSSPSEKLHVSGNIRLSGDINNGGNNTVGIYSNSSTTNSRSWIRLNDSNDTKIAGNRVQLFSGSTDLSEGTVAVTVNNSGNVGIGVTDPGTYKLNVNGDIKSSNLHVTNNANVSGSIEAATSIRTNSEFRIGGTSVTIFKTPQNAMMFKDATYSSGIALSAIATPSVNTKNLLQTGMIILWSGAIATIPEGFKLCDGQYGTPDLRGKFIIGRQLTTTGSTNFWQESCTCTGGNNTVTLAIGNIPQHCHPAGTLSTGTTGEHLHCVCGYHRGTVCDGNHWHTNYALWDYHISTAAEAGVCSYGKGHMDPRIGTSTSCRTDGVYGVNYNCAVCSTNCCWPRSRGLVDSSHSHFLSLDSQCSGNHKHEITGSTGNAGAATATPTAITITPVYYHLAYIMRTDSITP